MAVRRLSNGCPATVVVQLKSSQNKKDLNDIKAAPFFGVFFAAGSWEKDTEKQQLWHHLGPSYFVMTLEAEADNP